MGNQLNINKAPIDRVKTELSLRWLYVYLVLALHARGAEHDDAVKELRWWRTWLEQSTDNEIRAGAGDMIRTFDNEIRSSKGSLPPKKSWRKVASDFEVLYDKPDFDWKLGLPKSWVVERFDLTHFQYYEDFPYHGHIGIWTHAGVGAVEENLILKDAFLVLAKANKSYKSLFHTRDYANANAKGDAQSEQYLDLLRSVNADVCAYSRLAVLSFYSFVEAFVNSVATDFVARHDGISEKDKEILQGFKVGNNGRKRYFPIEDKIQQYPGIIRGTGDHYIILSDPGQIKEPYASFVGHIKAIRDSASHYSINKANIWFPPTEWFQTAEKACETCLGVARGFWSACYPGRPQPKYLYGLDQQELRAQAEDRVANEQYGTDPVPLSQPTVPRV
jgi:hypothetical protein